jgi:NTE family protein
VAKVRLAGSTRAEAEASVPGVELKDLDVSFDSIRDPEEREYLMNPPTSFVFPDAAVDHLRDAASVLLRQSLEYQSVVQTLGGEISK